MDPTTIRTVLAVLRRQWWVLLQAVAVVAALAGYLAYRTPDNPFQASATFLVKPDATSDASVFITRSTDAFLLSQKRLVTSEAVTLDVAERLGARDPQALRSSVRVLTDPSAGAITIVAAGPDPASPVLIANTFASVFIETQANQRTASLKARAGELEAQVAQIDERIADLTRDLNAAAQEGRDASSATAAKEAALRQYSSVAEQQQQVLTALATQPNLAEFIEPAKEPFQPPTPSVPMRAALGGVLGLLFGIGLAVLRELLDDRVRTAEDAGRLADATVLVEVPRAARSVLGGLPVLDGTDGALAESLRSLRTTVQFLGIERPIRAVAVSSPEVGDGKSTVAANLAAAYAMAGIRTVLVSGDLRKPSVDGLFGVAGELGFSDLLFDRARLRVGSDDPHGAPVAIGEFVSPTNVPNLAVLPAGSPTRSPAELLAAAGLAGIIDELTAHADMVVIDSPPTLVTDAVMLAKVVDGVLLVASVNKTRKSRMRAAAEQLRTSRVAVLGVVVNRTRKSEAGYGYYLAAPGGQSATLADGLGAVRS